MGTIVIETPFNTDLKYLIKDDETAESLIEDLEEIALPLKPNRSKAPAIKPPTVSRQEGLDAAFGILAKDEDSATLAQRIRKANRQIT